jgi:hypothetical protein
VCHSKSPSSAAASFFALTVSTRSFSFVSSMAYETVLYVIGRAVAGSIEFRLLLLFMEPIDVEDMFDAVRDNLRLVSRLPASSSPTLPNLILVPWRGKGWKTSSSFCAADSKATLSAIATVGGRWLVGCVWGCAEEERRDMTSAALSSEWTVNCYLREVCARK